MIRPTVLSLLITTLLVPASHAINTGTGLDRIPTSAEKNAQEQKVAEQLAAKKAAEEASAKADRLTREKADAAKALKAVQDQSAKDQAEIARLKAALVEKPAQPKTVSAPVRPAALVKKPANADQAKPDPVPHPVVATATAAPPTVPNVYSTTPGTRMEAYPGGPVLIALPTGSFTMGSAQKNSYDPDSVKPHLVRVAQAFAMGETELSFAQWDACVNDTRSVLRCKHKPRDRWGRSAQPVIRVTYDDIVQQYLPWLNAKTQAKVPYQFRLPTEAEWEYAARAGGKGEYSLGPNNSDKIDSSKANYDTRYSYADSPKGQYRRKTVPVNSFEPNAFGLYNMHGNVWEWTADCYYGDEYKRRETGGEWPAHKTSEEKAGCLRVLRGGSWYDDPLVLSFGYRSILVPRDRDDSVGFRIARTLLP